jgi:hypothetical protein
MSVGRLLRIAAFAIALPLVFQLSQSVAAASGNEPVEGLGWAIGALTILFFLRALATEYGHGPEANFHKDLQWGLAAGGVLTILTLVVGRR